eukprot:TRINITY_DN3433_c0_g1_i1.p1 TRINITY_DN3433_c0_g1~~TRINITY_DN3433_c0_g1_i1.p1  ORF type:complete len:301 (+),score=41.31 TRINITY_DN3433_c0_g1_i1:28-903(+)
MAAITNGNISLFSFVFPPSRATPSHALTTHASAPCYFLSNLQTRLDCAASSASAPSRSLAKLSAFASNHQESPKSLSAGGNMWSQRIFTTLTRRLLVERSSLSAAASAASGLLRLLLLSGSMAGTPSFTASAAIPPRISQAEEALSKIEWPEQFPFSSSDFQRFDESSDTFFYDSPRFVTHIDDPAIQALTRYYASVFPPADTPGVSILDLCSSWISHYPKNYRLERIVGLGLNEAELKRNRVLTEYVVQDLNANPQLPFDDNTFDIITNALLEPVLLHQGHSDLDADRRH